MGSGDMRWNRFYHRVKSARIDTPTAVRGPRGVSSHTHWLPGSTRLARLCQAGVCQAGGSHA